MTKSIIINAKGSILRASVIEDKALDNLFIDKNISSSNVGNIYLGKVSSILPSIQAVFIDIGIGKNGFLQFKNEYVDKLKKTKNSKFSIKYKKNDNILVQVVKDEIGTKGVRLDENISLPGRFLVMMLNGKGKVHISRKIVTAEHKNYLLEKVIPKLAVPKNVDLIIRTAASGVKLKYITRDFNILLKTAKQIEKNKVKQTEIACLHEELDLVRKIVRDWFDKEVSTIFVDDNKYYETLKTFIKKHLANPKVKLRYYKGNIGIFDKFGITKQIEKLYQKKVWLKCGGYLVIDKTEALVAIDVNTGKNVKHSSSEETIRETNIQAATEIARQLRLRNMGGIVIIDFIDMKNKNHQKEVLKHLQKSLEKDKAKSKVYPFTRLGLVQLTRQRVEESWEQHYFIDCERCGGTGHILSNTIISDQIISKTQSFLVDHPGVHLNIKAHSKVIQKLIENNKLDEIEKKFRIEIGYLKDDLYHPENFLIIRKDTGVEIF